MKSAKIKAGHQVKVVPAQRKSPKIFKRPKNDPTQVPKHKNSGSNFNDGYNKITILFPNQNKNKNANFSGTFQLPKAQPLEEAQLVFQGQGIDRRPPAPTGTSEQPSRMVPENLEEKTTYIVKIKKDTVQPYILNFLKPTIFNLSPPIARNRACGSAQ